MACISTRNRRIAGLFALLTMVMAMAGFLLPAAPAEAQTTTTVFVRRNVATLTPAQITSLRKGVQVMKDRSRVNPNDRTGWLYQANMHGISPVPSPLPPAINSCQHGSYFFLAWHRMYLYYFERILRKASGDPNLALPYWNYTDPTQRRLPTPYRSPASSSNSLYEPARAPGMNSGTASLPASATSFFAAFTDLGFTSPTGSGASFGGQRLTAPSHLAQPHGDLERQPHDVIHGLVGGQTGLMSYVTLAARDPIFWAHHANIDRLWKRWLDQGGGRRNPTTDSVWMNTTFTFIDENGQVVTMKGSQVLNTVTQLSYRYDDDPPAVTPIPLPTPAPIPGAAPEEPRAPELVATSSSSPVTLTGKTESVSVPVQQEARPRLAPAFAEVPDTRVILNIQGIQLEKQPGVYYEVYVNLPPGAAPDFQSIYYAGNLPFFGFEAHADHAGPEGGSHSFDITALARELKAQNQWNEGNVAVTFVPRGLVGATGQTAAAPQATPPVKVGKITLTSEE